METNIRKYFESLPVLESDRVAGESFYRQLINDGYECFGQVTEAIKKGELPEELFEKGFDCDPGIVGMLIDASKGSKLEETAKRMIEAKEVEAKILNKMASAAEEIGYPLESQEKDRERGRSQEEIDEKVARYRYIHSCITESVQK